MTIFAYKLFEANGTVHAHRAPEFDCLDMQPGDMLPLVSDGRVIFVGVNSSLKDYIPFIKDAFPDAREVWLPHVRIEKL